MGSENPSGADNQQETVRSVLDESIGTTSLDEILTGSSETARQAPDRRHAITADRGKVQSDPHGDMGSQAEMT